MANGPISPSQGYAMTTAYTAYMQKLGVDMTKQTQSVSFVSTDLLSWMNSVKMYADEFRICLGVYPDGADEGRITVIVWPYKAGKPSVLPTEEGKDAGPTQVPPYNTGTLNP